MELKGWPLNGSPICYLPNNNGCFIVSDNLCCIYRQLNRKEKAMKKETRNLIIENIGLAWVYASPKARQYLNVALQGFAQHEREQDAAIDKLAAYVMEEADQLTSQPRKGK